MQKEIVDIFIMRALQLGFEPKKRGSVINVSELAKKAGIPQPTLHRILTRPHYEPKFPQLVKLLRALQMPWLEVFYDEKVLNIIWELLRLDNSDKDTILKIIYALRTDQIE